jgi:hypothetical protein
LILGAGILLPGLFLLVSGFGTRQHKIGDVLRAQAITSKTPLWMHYALVCAGVFCLCAAVVRLYPID